MKKVAIGLAVFFCALVAYELSPLFLPVKHTGGHGFYCDRCGKTLVTSSEYWNDAKADSVEQRTLRDTELSQWYADHFADRCEHTWVSYGSSHKSFVCVAGYNVKDLGAESGASRIPKLLDLGDDELSHLEELFQESPVVGREYIHGRLQRRRPVDEDQIDHPKPVPEGPAI